MEKLWRKLRVEISVKFVEKIIILNPIIFKLFPKLKFVMPYSESPFQGDNKQCLKIEFSCINDKEILELR